MDDYLYSIEILRYKLEYHKLKVLWEVRELWSKIQLELQEEEVQRFGQALEVK